MSATLARARAEDMCHSPIRVCPSARRPMSGSDHVHLSIPVRCAIPQECEEAQSPPVAQESGGRIVFHGIAPCPALRIALLCTVNLAIRATARNRHKDGLGLGRQRAKGLSRTEANMHV